MTPFEAGVNGSPRGWMDAPERKCVLVGGLYLPCTNKEYERVNQKSYLRKKITGTK